MTFQETRLQGSLGDVALKSNPLNKKKGKLSVSEMGFSTWRRGDVAEKEKVASEAAAGQKPPTAEMELPSWGGAPKEKGQGWKQNVANRQEVSDASCLKRCCGKLPKRARESWAHVGSKVVLKWDLWHGGEAAVQARIRRRTVDAEDTSMMDNPFAQRRDGGVGGDDMASTLSASGSVEMVAMDVEGGAKD